MEPGSSFFLSRRSSRTSYTEEDDQHSRMSDIEESNTNHSPFGRRRSSSCTSIPSSPSSSYNKMSVDSDDGRSICSPTYSTAWGKQRIAPLNDNKNVRRPTALFRQWQQEQQQAETPTQECQSLKSSMDGSFSAMDQDTFARPRLRPSRSSTTLSPSSHNKKQPQKEHPERRTVRRTSLLLKSKALSRVMHQAEEETHLADLEMRQEHGATSHLKSRYPDTTPPPPPLPLPSAFPFPPWATTASSMPIDISSPSSSSSLSSSPMAYQCSKLNPELEMTNFQFENLPSPMQSSFKSIKRKASEDRLLDTTCLSGLKRRAVSPSVSLSGSPILAASTSPPATSLSSSSITSSPSSHASYFQCSGNAAARTSPSQSSSKGFNLHEASGGISRMSLSE